MTTTSNIHVGLAAWSNHTFTLAERCSTGGNAYQCILAGTSTSAPTGISSDVDNGGVAHFKWLSAIDYTTIAAWVAGIIGTLTQPVVGLLWNDGIIQCTLGTILFNIDGHVTTTTNTITLKCAPGESIHDQISSITALTAASTKGVTIRGAASGGPTSVSYVWISDDNVIIDGIQFIDPYATGLSQMMLVQFATNFRIQRCIFDGYSSSISGANLLDLGTGALAYQVVNCLFVDRATSNVLRCVLSSDAATTAGKVVCCTFVSLSTSGEAMQGAATAASGVMITDCAAFGQINPFTASNNIPAVVVDHSVMSASTLTFSTSGTGNLFSKTAGNQFVSATVDFRLLVGADCRNVGVTDTTNIPLSDDFFGTSRGASGWDAGCYEYSVSASTAALAFFG